MAILRDTVVNGALRCMDYIYVTGKICSTTEGIELYTKENSGHGGYIDFHYNGNNSADYTTRIIGSSEGIQVNGGSLTVFQHNIVAKGNADTYITDSNIVSGCSISFISQHNGNHGIFSSGYYNGSTYKDSGRWLIYRNVNNVSVLDGDVYFTGNIVGQKNIRAFGASDVHIYSENTTSKCYSSCRSLNNGQHGLYSNGYWNGSSFVLSGVWMMYRDTEGLVRTKSCSGTDSTPLVNTSTTQGKRLSGAHCYTSTQLALYGQWGTSGTTYAWRFVTVTTSDPRLKENIEPTKMNALELINKINLYSFDWKNDDTPHYDVGYLATELYELDHNLAIKPDDESEGYWGVNDFYMSGVQTKAIQELSKENEELRRKIQSLERRISLVENAKNDVTH